MAVAASSEKRVDLLRREDRLVYLLLETFGLQARRKTLVHMQDQQHGIKYLTLHAWRAFYPTFPIYLAYELLYGLGNGSSVWKVRDIASEAWHETFDVLSAQGKGDVHPVGLVFPYRGLRYGMMIHNGAYHCRRYLVDRDCFETDASHLLTIEPTRYVVQSIYESGWEPDAAWKAVEGRIAPAPLLRQVNSTTAKLVLSLLIDVLNGDVERHPDWLGYEHPDKGESRNAALLPGETIVRIAGRRHIALTQQEIGDALGLSIHQVRNALRQLRKAKLVKSRLHDNISVYRVLTAEE